MAIGLGAALLASSAISAGAGIYASSQAAAAEREAAERAGGLYDVNLLEARGATKRGLSYLKPFLEPGTEAYNRLAATTRGDFAGFTETPGYQFRLGEGIKALDRSASARGRTLSGPQIKAVQRYGEGLASSEFGNYQNRLAQLAGFGLDAASRSAGLESTLGSNVLGSTGTGMAPIMAAGQATGEGFTGAASSVNAGVENALNAMILENALRRPTQNDEAYFGRGYWS
jgi:hypothetical protein